MRRFPAALLLLAACTGCERSKSPPRNGSVTTSVVTTGGTAPAGTAAAARRWDDTLGTFVATPSFDSGTPVLFVRDTANASDFEVELFNHDTPVVRATMHPGAAASSCAWQRTATIVPAAGQSAPLVWSLALAPGTATPFGIDAIDDLAPRDSATFAATISRLVSALPEDSSSAPFRGLPIVVRDAWRFKLSDSTTIAVAIAARSLNIESNPRSEIVSIIAEPDPAAGSAGWRIVFARRDSGPEDRVEGADLLAALRLKDGAPIIAFVRESDSGLQIDIVQRTAPFAWHVRWSSAFLPCGG
jgi:hypothetical protein